jgi:diguanylate cyclase (GGDEF)-like protein
MWVYILGDCIMQIYNKRVGYDKRRKIFTLIGLTLAAVMGNYFSVTLYSGVDFIFGSIAVLLITEIYGTYYGIGVSIIASSYTYVMWNHPFAIFIYGLEIAAIGFFRKKNGNLIIRDLIFWVTLGAPLIWLIYNGYMNITPTETILIILKEIVNGIFNSLAASILLSYIPFFTWLSRTGKKRAVPISQILFNLVVACVLIPAIILSIFSSSHELGRIKKEIINNLDLQSIRMSGVVANWQIAYMDILETLARFAEQEGVRESPELQSQVDFVNETVKDYVVVYVTDKEGNTVAASPSTDMFGGSTKRYNYSDRFYYKELQRTMEPVIDYAEEEKIVKHPTITMSVPIVNDGEFIGCVTGAIDTNSLPGILSLSSFGEGQYITIIDRDNNVIATTNPQISPIQKFMFSSNVVKNSLDRKTNLVVPKDNHFTASERWRNTYYMREVGLGYDKSWRLIIQVPFKPYQEIMEEFYIRIFIIMIIFILAALTAANLLTRGLTGPIRNLSQVTTRLTAKLLLGEEINWPSSGIFEVSSLINNFKQTANILTNKFIEVKKTKEQLESIVYHDSMTGLPNRIMFYNRLEEEIKKAREAGMKFAVMFLDLDRFKVVNDTLGHSWGDELLRLISERIFHCIHEDYLLARIGGDEFTLLMPNIGDDNEISEMAERIIGCLDKQLLLNNQEFHITVSIGIAVYPGHGDSVMALIKNADLAMYRAKENGKNNYKFFDSSMHDTLEDKLILENNLRRALEREEYILYYQPQLDLKTGKIIGMEALIRWNSLTLGMVSPAKFIPLLEETGLIIQVGEWVLRTACLQNKAWQDEGLIPVKVSVNLSAKQFQQRDLVERVETILKETGLEARWLELEITESITIENVDFTVKMLQSLKEMGVSVSLDDFGTGFSSLSYLKNFKIDTLKIDSSFVKDIQNGENDASIVSTIISLAKNMKLKVIAEGVETEKQMSFLKENGCDEIQGYIYSKPLPGNEIRGFLI